MTKVLDQGRDAFVQAELETVPIIKCGTRLVPFNHIRWVDIRHLENGSIYVMTDDGMVEAKGFDAIELVMLLKPSALEGRRLKWPKGAWAFHNIVGHPLMQFLAWLGFPKAAIRLHDATTPTPRQ